MDREYNVLFLCTGNSARSLIAEAIMTREGKGRFKAFSAGSHPASEAHPFALDILKTANHDISSLKPKDWAEFSKPEAPQMDFVFTVCDATANETCPIWPGQPMTAHWGLPDPAEFKGTETEKRVIFSDTYRMLNNRISIFVNLPMDSIDKLSLQTRLDEIGRDQSEAAS